MRSAQLNVPLGFETSSNVMIRQDHARRLQEAVCGFLEVCRMLTANWTSQETALESQQKIRK